jgi:hypothetical protein
MQTTASGARRLGAVAAVAAFVVLLATTALAAPARQGAVSASAPVYSWDGGPANGSGAGVAAVRCTPAVYECEDTLVEVKDAGDLLAEIKAGAGANDLDVAIYKSDSSGTTAGDPVNGDQPNAEDTSTGKDAKVTLKKAAPGFYVVRVRIFDGVQAVWKGSATLKVPAPPPPPPAPAVTPPPPASEPANTPAKPSKPSAKERRNACMKKAKKIRNKRKKAKAVKRCKRIR